MGSESVSESVLVWGLFFAGGLESLLFIDVTIDQNIYLKLLMENLQKTLD